MKRNIAQEAVRTDWRKEQINLNEEQQIQLFVNPNIDPKKTFFLPTVPQITFSQAHKARAAFSIILNQEPGVEETNIYHYIKRSQLTMELSMALPTDLVQHIKTSKIPQNYQPLFIQKIDYQLISQQEEGPENRKILASATGSMGQGNTKISVFLEKTDTLAVLDILQQQPSCLFLALDVTHRGASYVKTVILKGNWAAIYDFIQAKMDQATDVPKSMLLSCLADMQQEGILQTTTTNGEQIILPIQDLMSLFSRQMFVVLQESNHTQEGEDLRYFLRNRPHESFYLNYQQSITTSSLKTYQLEVPLEYVLANALHTEENIHILVEEGGDIPVLKPITKRQGRTKKSVRSNRGGGDEKIQLATYNGQVTSLSFSTQPSFKTHAVPNLNLLALYTQPFYYTFLNDLVLESNLPEQLQNLPVVNNTDEPYWRDRISSDQFWYAPIFEITPPEPAKSAEENTFSFTFERTGATDDGQVGLKGVIRFQLTKKMSNATEIALANDNITNIRPVEPLFLQVNLIIPFIDSADGTLKYHPLVADIKDEGTHLVAEVALLNNWVKLAYGALSLPNFQAEAVSVKVIYSFKNYSIVHNNQFEFTYGGKALYTPLLYEPTPALNPVLAPVSYFDAHNLTYVHPTFNINMAAIAHHQMNIGPRGRGGYPFLATTMFSKPVVTTRPILANTFPINPTLTLVSTLQPFLTETQYATRTQVRQQTMELLIPCDRLGHLYQEKVNHTMTALGCQDALRLGTTEYKQYQELLNLRDEDYFKVYQSLQQPGHFLVVPHHFCISRRAAGEEDAYQPLIFLNSLIDSQNAQNNRVELRMTLQPDIPVFKRIELEEKLKTLSPEPTINYPTDIISESLTFNWALDASIQTRSDVELSYAQGPFLSTLFSMNLANWQLLKTLLTTPGIRGNISFELADGTALTCGLFLKLDQIRGPWKTGPISVLIENNKTQLTNHVEGEIAISHLANFSNSRLSIVPVETIIKAGESHAVDGQHGLTPVYSYLPADDITLEEIRSFVEDIYTEIIFVNLVNMTNHGLQRLVIEAKMQGMTENISIQLTPDMPVQKTPIVLPLTSYLENRILDFRIIKHYIDSQKASETTVWMKYNLQSASLVSVTPDLIAAEVS